MIKVRVDWRHECPGCGTELVSDFLDDSTCRETCPWCGHEFRSGRNTDPELRDYVAKAASEIEKKANGRIPV